VTRRTPKNIAASVRQRLLIKARGTGRPFGELLQYFAVERFLYRLSKSRYADHFVLKGALMLNVWQARLHAQPWTLIYLAESKIASKTSLR
jgi:hypothetical protein